MKKIVSGLAIAFYLVGWIWLVGGGGIIAVILTTVFFGVAIMQSPTNQRIVRALIFVALGIGLWWISYPNGFQPLI